jgi:hypothetical protein
VGIAPYELSSCGDKLPRNSYAIKIRSPLVWQTIFSS